MTLRYLTDFDTHKIEMERWDVVIIGSGIAGLYSAVNLDPGLKICVISKETMAENNSYLAQGGIAAAIGEDDMPVYHFDDTIKAGAGHCNEKAVSVLVEEAPKDIDILCSLGTNFDRNVDGTLTKTREGGHGRFRIVHALGDATGKEVVDSLLRVCRSKENITIKENCYAIDILVNDGRCTGVLIAAGIGAEAEKQVLYCRSVICASGGIGQVYKNTTNSEVVTGDGIAMAYRAGAVLADMEFVQFHPTAFYKPDQEGSRFLISEAVRGEGGILLNRNLKPFMHKYHSMGEIAPRDIVSRAIFSEMKETDTNWVLLDITHKDADYLKKRFPTIYGRCLKEGVDITKDHIPVSPVQHYFMGGIRTDLRGRTNIEGLYACGEAANTGVHGANRLASNSLLEGLVFGRRCAGDINNEIHKWKQEEVHIFNSTRKSEKYLNMKKIRDQIRTQMDAYAGIERNATDMKKLSQWLDSTIQSMERTELVSTEDMEAMNIAYIASLILKSAIIRRESCGSHYRVDSE